MGLMNRMMELRNAQVGRAPESKGSAVLVTGSSGDTARTMELWGVPGVWTVPPDGTHGIRHPVGGSDKWGAVVGTHHYGTQRPILAKGENAFGSTSADGLLVKAKVIARADGTLELNGTGKRLITNDLVGILATFITALNASLATAGGTPVSLNISSAVTTTLKTDG